MRQCPSENLIDDYLFERLSGEKTNEFEEHYFNCPRCYEKVEQKHELLSVIRARGEALFKDTQPQASTAGQHSSLERLFAFLTPKQWALTVASAAILLAVGLGIFPGLKPSRPQFFVNNDLVRGKAITLISPVINVKSVPSQFKWTGLGESTEYKIYIYNQELLWSATTRNDFIDIPREVKASMVSGEKYSWEVKAFSPNGNLISVSGRVHFRLDPAK